MKTKKPTASETVAQAWSPAPTWVHVLAAHCDNTSQRDAAARLRRSPALVNAVLKNVYKGDLKAVQQRVEKTFLVAAGLAAQGAPPVKISAVARVHQSWPTPPAWVLKLAVACDEESQKSVADKIGRSGALVNQVLKNTYKGNMQAVAARVKLVFGEEVDCPVLGDITGGECLTWQNRPRLAVNHHLVRMYIACRSCPHNISRKDKP